MSLDDRNAVLEEKLENNPIDETIDILVRQAKRNKNNIRWLALSIVLDILLTIVITFITIRTQQLQKQSETNKNAIVARCENTNEARARSARLWDYLIDQSKDQPRTPDQEKFRNDFIKLKNETFAPSDCKHPSKQQCYNHNHDQDTQEA